MRCSMPTDAGKQEIGAVTSAIWSPTCKRNIALAMIDAPHFAWAAGVGGNLSEPRTGLGTAHGARAGRRTAVLRARAAAGDAARRISEQAGRSAIATHAQAQKPILADRPWLDPARHSRRSSSRASAKPMAHVHRRRRCQPEDLQGRDVRAASAARAAARPRCCACWPASPTQRRPHHRSTAPT